MCFGVLKPSRGVGGGYFNNTAEFVCGRVLHMLGRAVISIILTLLVSDGLCK